MKFNSLLKASVLALSLAVAGTAAAQGNQGGPKPSAAAEKRAEWREARGGDCDFRGHMFGMSEQVAFVVPGYGPVTNEFAASLNLTDEQNEKIAAVKAKIIDQAEARRDQRGGPFVEMAELRKKQLADNKMDPEALLKKRDELRDTWQDRRGEFTDDWLEVWNALDDEQQAKLAGYFRDMDEKRAQRMKDKRRNR